MNKQEYAKCIEDDIDFLKRHLPESLFKCLWTGHIIEVLKASINMLYDQPSLPSNLEEAAKKCVDSIIYENCRYDGDFIIPVCEDIFKAGAEWLEGQGINYEAIISADKTIPVLPMKDVSDMGLDYGDKVIVQIRKKD